MTSTDRKAAVIVTSKFVQSGSSTFSSYVTYLDRDEAKKEEPTFSSYNDYMDDGDKATSLFTAAHNSLSSKQKDDLKEVFQKGQERGSILYQDVISFDNNWLEENGIYDRKTKNVNEEKLKEVTRKAMKDMHDKNEMGNNLVWSGAIHHNTDNIHIHVASVDLSPSKDQRGKRKLKSLEGVKSTFVNKIQDRSAEHQKINDIIRKEIVHDKKERKTFSTFDRKFKKDFMQIYKQLPENKRYWSYGYENINHVKPALNQLTKDYINHHYKKEFNELDKRLDREVAELKRAYGEGGEHRYKDYKKNKMADLEKRMGNAFLSEMKSYDRQVKQIKSKKEAKKYTRKYERAKTNVAFKQMKYGLDRVVHSEMTTGKNQAAHERLQRDIERSNQR
ncbi:MobP2 family relaxase [Alkalicoccus luteus]|uniref:Uncharacterized protein n=1 Tax=Alkalicoccus luteus TaxID=1237094 RepID=A0A969PW52_9BACI|nr:MobP2 family relaxase [Alkalicoccus luteus]NJP38988.1 hypothetical protein [Alkalicoccus luteus]